MSSKDDDEKFPTDELTPSERAEFRRMLRNDKRAKWLWRIFKQFLIALAALIVTLGAVGNVLWEWLQALRGMR